MLGFRWGRLSGNKSTSLIVVKKDKSILRLRCIISVRRQQSTPTFYTDYFPRERQNYSLECYEA